MSETRYLRTQHLGWQDEQRLRAGVFDDGSTVPVVAFCGDRVQRSDVLWLERPLARPLSVDTRDFCQGCLAEWVERRVMHPVNIVHSSYGRSDGRPLCGASTAWRTDEVLDGTTCGVCRRMLKERGHEIG